MNIKRPRVKDKEIRIQEIQAAARKVFFKKGYQNSTIEEIAKRAGIREGTVYLYFKNKEDLYISLMIPVTERMGEQIKNLEDGGLEKNFKNGSELMKAIIDINLGAYEYDPKGVRIIQAYQQGNLFSGMSRETRKKLDIIARSNFQTMRRILSRAKDLGFFKKDVNEIMLTDVFWGLFMGVVALEESKLRVTKKNHLYPMMHYAYSLITQAILPTDQKQAKKTESHVGFQG